MRDLALQAAEEPVSSVFYGNQELREFQLDLPREAPMLPHLLAALLEIISLKSSGLIWSMERRLPSRKEISQQIAKYVLSSIELRKIASNQSLPRRIQAAAMSLYCLHPDEIANPAALPNKENVVDLYEPAESHWYLPAIALLLADQIAANQSDAIKAIGGLLAAADMDFKGRSAANYAIHDWRELAKAPVQHLNLPQLWM